MHLIALEVTNGRQKPWSSSLTTAQANYEINTIHNKLRSMNFDKPIHKVRSYTQYEGLSPTRVQ